MPKRADATPSLHDPGVYRQCRERVTRLTPDATPAWGEMTVTRMLAHCAEVQRVMNGAPLQGTPWLFRLAGPLFKRLIVSPRPFPKRSRTHPQYEITEEGDFDTEKARLLREIAAFRDAGEQELAHPIFGRLSAHEAGWTSYKHLDHHLRQFGV